MKKLVFGSVIALSLSAVVFQSCKKDDNPPPPKPTLYDSLGGTAMVADPTMSGVKIEAGRLLIRNIIDSTIFVIAADPSINPYFTSLLQEVTAGNLSGFQELSMNLTDFVAVGTGAKNYKYTGLDMVATHDPAKNNRMNGKANNAAMDSFEKDLVMGAGKAGVPANTPALQSVAKLVESLRGQVVQR